MSNRSGLRRTSAAVAVAAGVAAAVAASSSAAQPIVVEKNVLVVGDVAPSTACAAYGYTFTFSSHFEATRTITHFVDNDGSVIREVFGIHAKATWTNDLTGKTLTGDSERHIVRDLVENTFTETGVMRNVTTPGLGIVWHEAGRLVGPLPRGSAPPTFEAGPHEWTHNELAAFCAALADP